MTDPDTPPGTRQPEAARPSLPDSAGDPRTAEAANPSCDPGDVSSQRTSEEVTIYGEAPGSGDRARRSEIVPASQTGQIYGLTEYLDSFAGNFLRAQAEALASAIPKINLAEAFHVPGMQAISKMAVLPEPGLLKIRLSAVPLAVGLSEPAIARHFLPTVPDLGFRRAISTMVSSWDRGLLGINQQLAASATALVEASQQALNRSMADFASSIRAAAFGPMVDFAAVSASVDLVDLLRSWRETAETGLGLLGGLARAAYRAALCARAAVLNGENEPVAWFIEAWLRMRATPERIEAVSAALLEEGWDASIPEDADCLLTDLRSRTARQARALRPIWENQLNYRTIGSLDRAVTTDNGTLLAVADLVPGPQTTEDLALANEYEEQRIRMVLSRLKPDELQVTDVWAQCSDLTWAEAAQLAGAANPAAAGERVRCKLKRLGAKHSRRLAQAGAS